MSFVGGCSSRLQVFWSKSDRVLPGSERTRSMGSGSVHSGNVSSFMPNIRGSIFFVSHRGGQDGCGMGGRRHGRMSFRSVSMSSPSGLLTV